MMDRLCATFPAVFNRQTPKPLKVGIGQEVLVLAGVHPAFTDLARKDLRRALAAYTRAFRYRKALAAGGPRYDLDGQPAGEVTPEQQAHAQASQDKKVAATTPAATATTSPAVPAPTLSPAKRQALLEEVMAMAIPGKLEVTLKITQLPQAKPASPSTLLFAVQSDGRKVIVEVKNKPWNTLKKAAENYPQWVAVITGQMGEAIEGGFRLENPSIQVFEKKPKPDAAMAPSASEPAAPMAPPQNRRPQ
ncbi:MAG: ProQ/FinO family protein [Gammaproteobacteria bacterium]|nr:ProQ/FinO family protein [Gammaproteobacteria bacterium]